MEYEQTAQHTRVCIVTVCPTRTCTVSSLGQISTEHVIWCLEHVTLLFSVVVNSNVNIEMYLLLAVFDLVAVEQAFMHTETGGIYSCLCS